MICQNMQPGGWVYKVYIFCTTGYYFLSLAESTDDFL
jgi:hypothetical protein